MRSKCFFSLVFFITAAFSAGAAEPKSNPDPNPCAQAMFWLGKTPISDSDFGLKVTREKPEFLWLTGSVNATPENSQGQPQAGSPSEKIFGKKHIEFDRTYVSISALKWVLEGNREQLVKPQPDSVRLHEDSSAELRAYVQKELPDAEATDAMVTYEILNDVGKIQGVVNMVKRLSGFENVDHDKILLLALKNHPETFPSFKRLSPKYQRYIIEGLQAQFNIAQFIQGENVAASLKGLVGLEEGPLNFYLIHALFDMAGAAGHVNSNGSLVLTEPTYRLFMKAIKAIQGLNAGRTVKQVYEDFFADVAKIFGLDASNPLERAVLRISLMVRANTPAQAQEVKSVLTSIPENARAILIAELNRTGLDDGFATLLYYSPATILNAQAAFKAAGESKPLTRALEVTLLEMANLYQQSRIAVKHRKGDGVFTINIAKVAEAAKNPTTLLNYKVELKPVGEDAEVVLSPRNSIDLSAFGQVGLNEIPGQSIIPIGIGGGSDVIQAAILGAMMKNYKRIPAVISIRTSKPTSQGATNQIAETRTIENHGGEIARGVYRVLPESTGSGRFLENIPASQFPVYLVIDAQNGTLGSRIQAAIKDAGGADTLLAVDTGGDALHSSSVSEGTRATPDQDLRVLKTLGDFTGYTIMTAEIAVGVDSPENAEAVLKNAKARFHMLNANESVLAMTSYKDWRMDGSDETRFGKTPLAWQLAISEKFGFQTLPLPKHVVMDPKNPWDTFGFIQPAMRGIFISRLSDHLKAIGVLVTSQAKDVMPELMTSLNRLWKTHRGSHILLLMPGDFAKLPAGTVLEDIFGARVVVGRDSFDDETRGGFMAYGLGISETDAQRLREMWKDW